MPDFTRPTRLADALAMLGAGRILAGGTDIYPTEAGRAIAGDVIDITGLAELQGISQHAGGVRIGACVSWAEIAAAADLPMALRQAARVVGGRQIQNAGTIGGNLCNASPAADGVPPLLVLEAQVELASVRGVRQLALGDFLIGPRKVDLAADEVLVAVHLPTLRGETRFLKLGARAYLVISIAMVAVRLVVARGVVVEAALAVGACSGVARRLPGVEAGLVGVPVGELRILDSDVAAALDPMDDLRGSAGYRAGAAAELLRRAVAEVLA
ncbi:MAG: FAD binding domain-containing protein [Paracoccaceae bacterium]